MFVVKDAHLLTLERLCLQDEAGTHAAYERYTARKRGAAYVRPKHGCLGINIEPVAGT